MSPLRPVLCQERQIANKSESWEKATYSNIRWFHLAQLLTILFSTTSTCSCWKNMTSSASSTTMTQNVPKAWTFHIQVLHFSENSSLKLHTTQARQIWQISEAGGLSIWHRQFSDLRTINQLFSRMHTPSWSCSEVIRKEMRTLWRNMKKLREKTKKQWCLHIKTWTLNSEWKWQMPSRSTDLTFHQWGLLFKIHINLILNCLQGILHRNKLVVSWKICNIKSFIHTGNQWIHHMTIQPLFS